MHVCLVHRDIHQVTRGGICTVYRSLAVRLAGRRHEVTILSQETPHPWGIPGVRVLTLPRTDDLAAHRRAVAMALQAVRPDVVDCSTWEAETLDYLCQRERRAPVLVRGDLSGHTMGDVELARAEWQLVRLADRVIAVSGFAAQDLAGAYGIPTPAVVHNGVDRARFRPGPADPPASGFLVAIDDVGRITHRTPLSELTTTGHAVPPWAPDPAGRLRLVWVGKITPMKGWDHLARLAARLREVAHITVLVGHSNALCAAAIDGGAVTMLQDLADADLAGFYRAADFLLCTSRWEGFGLAIAEALACGTPALLPAGLGTAQELLSAGGGLTYEDDDQLARLLVARPEVTGRLPDRFDWDTNADASLTVYRELIEDRGRASCASW